MQRQNDKLLSSASDLVAFLGCQHLSTLDRQDLYLDQKMPRAAPDEQMKLVQDKGFAHEESYLQTLRDQGLSIVELKSAGGFAHNQAATLDAMAQGVDLIFQAALADGAYMGYADFVRRVPTPSRLGPWSYEVADTKLALRAKPKFIIQLAHYSELLAAAQGGRPQYMHLVFGDRSERSFRLADYLHYYQRLRQRFEAFMAQAPATEPERCEQCSLCDWRERCSAQWQAQDHLNGVANITKVQIKRLRTHGIHTMAELGALVPSASVPGMQSESLHRLRAQAALQQHKKQTAENRYELLARNLQKPTGFDGLAPPDAGDLYFDMEGDPLQEGGLEYLFGVYYLVAGVWTFKDFWAHNRIEEKQCFARFIDFVTAHLQQHPGAHIYHYAHYEPTALKKLMTHHGVRESEVDQLLRTHRFVDLYQVVRHAVRVSEPGYSIKNLEAFYMPKRQGEVTNAGASIVYYEKWRQTGDPELLRKIRDYNEDDCRSTQLLHQWLLSIQPLASPWPSAAAQEVAGTSASERVKAHEARLATYEGRLVSGVAADPTQRDAEQRLRVLMFQLLDFHRRADKPAYWAMFERFSLSDEELMADAECIAGLHLLSVHAAATGPGAQIATYRYPEQDFKLRQGDACIRTDTGRQLGTLVRVDENKLELEIQLSAAQTAPPAVSISTGWPINTQPIKEALFRLADSLIDGGMAGNRFRAALDFLRKAAPRIQGHAPGQPILDEGAPALPQIIQAVAALDHSTLFIQGPPGAGKTYTGSHVIVELLARGKRVGVSSNSHKAIQNLLSAVEEKATQRGLVFKGIYKATNTPDGLARPLDRIKLARDNRQVFAALADPSVNLYAGTAWLMSAPELDDTLDYLFVDEAGQVATANLVAMATSATNIVLLGDQMQLGQPVQGVHPGESGLSALDFLLEGHATIAPQRGIFLATTWRMHPDVCRFISQAVYEGRLQPQPDNAHQRLLLGAQAHPALRPTGLVFVPAVHDGCSQRSAEEAAIVLDLYQSLLSQRYRDRDGREHAMSAEHILVVAPYNMQVDLLRRTLPTGARVGTVDKFQGQEAEVVIVSMATSNGDHLPRNIEFLYSKNRLNVALSRARSLALLVANPALADISCATVEQMGLVNLVCGAMGHASR